MRWFRFYDDAINDAKILRLSDALFRAWVTLLCLASKNGGVLPPASDIALVLRMRQQAVSVWIAGLVGAGLLDKKDDGTFVPHNWEGRQYKSDVSTGRVKQHRNKKRNVSCNVSSDVSETAPEQKQNRTDQNDVAADARASGNLVTPEAIQLAERLLVIAGHDPAAWPPGWCGAPMRVQSWLSEGWKAEIIVAAVQSAAKRKHGPPANSVQFFEKSIAEEVARQSAPLPKVEIREAETITVNHAKPKSGIIQAADDLIRKLASFDGPAGELDELRGGAGQASPRLLSHG